MESKLAMEMTKLAEAAVTTYCYSYKRISTKKQLKGVGIERQLEESAVFCEQQGWTMDSSFHLTDIGKSAYHGKHLDHKAALGSFLKSVDEGKVKRPAVLLVESLDRLSRANIMVAMELFTRIINSGISICSYVDRMVYSQESLQANPYNLIISIASLARGNEESELKSRRIKDSWRRMDERVRQGELGRPIIYPDWIDISSGKPEIIESKAALIREIFDLSVSKNMSFADIMNTMVDKHGKTYDWSFTKTWRILSSLRVLGFYENKDGEHIKAYPAVIDEEVFYRAKSAASKRKKLQVGRPSKRAINFFKTMMFCGECGRTVRGCGSGKSTSYHCHSTQLKLKCGQKSKLMVNKFQPILFHALSLVNKDDMLESESSQKKAGLIKEINGKQAELEDKYKRIENLVELIETSSDKDRSKTLDRQLAIREKEAYTISGQIRSLQDELEMLSSPFMAASLERINSFHQRFTLDQATKEDQEPFIDAMRNTIEKIIIHSPEQEGLRTKAVIHLLSGIEITVIVAKDYSANISKGKKLIGMLEARK